MLRLRAPSPARSALLLGLGLLVAATGCRSSKAVEKWIPEDAAVVRCTVAGPNFQLPALVDELPTPTPPTGMLALNMDPIALDELGYERDRPVCASLMAPSAQEIQRARETLDNLEDLRRDVAVESRKLGPCRCTYAEAMDAAGLIPGCYDRPTSERCAAEADKVAALDEILDPLRAELERALIPRTHWRMVGRSDRLGRFEVRHAELIARHPGGSEVYLQKTPLPPRHGMRLVSLLLSLDDVVAVVSQDSGRALLVVREVGDLLVLDHFGYPKWSGRVDPQLQILLSYLDDTQTASYREALAAPALIRSHPLEPSDGYLIELDRDALERADQAALISAQFSGVGYDDTHEHRQNPPLLVDRISLQVPFGTEGKRLRAYLRLTEQGRQWASAAADTSLVEALSTLGLGEFVPEYEPTRKGVEALFLLRGTPVEQLLFAGPTALPKVLAAVEAANPGSVEGSIESWEVEFPVGALPSQLETRAGAEGLRERLAMEPHELRGELVDEGRAIRLALEPR
ncbi:hypothetical protein G6O69_15155 [Pseudenhygromyxa sp. WMMC2535]|uniref:hypothetical protein n=1 Tax=Pseudenhygromyxa sp. WMMC2535 TaxID=2712867 RepID=UPI00155362D1|nr:hypothetical protein [Pseudenhygromyxa sp. WMMC2535]NVB39179.1 hypothetical protein [Pseudenhygromyxa sp. WMMC2535]